MTVGSKLITAEELLTMGNIGRCELIQGELIMMSPAGLWHGLVAMRLGRFLSAFVEDHDLGVVLAAETGFKIESAPDTVRAPDSAFVSKLHLSGKITPKFFDGVPDLAVEVVLPDDTRREVVDKANMWLASGTRVVWIADPSNATIAVHRVGIPVELLKREDILREESLLPGFAISVDLIFKAP